MPIPAYTTSFTGIGALTVRELRQRFGIDASESPNYSVRNYEIIRFATENVGTLGDLRTTEDVFFELGQEELTGHRADGERVGDLLRQAPIEQAISAKRKLTPKTKPGRPTYRVIVQAEDAPWRQYRREHLEAGAARGIADRYRKWKQVEDESQIEIWIQVAEKTAIVGLRLTDRVMRHRDYKVSSLPGSLRPTIAAASVLLGKPTDSDVFLDPSCGAGTILIERALTGPHQMLYGGDINDEAVQATLTNLGNRHKPWDVRQWDATALPLDTGSVTRVVTNPPWGRQISLGQSLNDYYQSSLAEMTRVLAPWGRAVILTSEWRAVQECLKASPALKIDEQIRDIRVMGRRADLFSLIRTNI